MIVVLKVPRCHGGGPSVEQRAAAAREATAAENNARTQQQMLDIYNKAYNEIEPYGTSRLNNGLPFYSDLIDYAGGENARAYQPARARLMRVLNTMPDLPSGSKAQSMADFEAQRARDFDATLADKQLLNEQAKAQGAGVLTGQQTGANPLGWSNATTAANSSIMQAPLQKPSPLGAILGAGATLGSAAISKAKF